MTEGTTRTFEFNQSHKTSVDGLFNVAAGRLVDARDQNRRFSPHLRMLLASRDPQTSARTVVFALAGSYERQHRERSEETLGIEVPIPDPADKEVPIETLLTQDNPDRFMTVRSYLPDQCKISRVTDLALTQTIEAKGASMVSGCEDLEGLLFGLEVQIATYEVTVMRGFTELA